MDRRSLIVGVVIGAVLAGLGYGGLAHGQYGVPGGGGDVGAYQGMMTSNGNQSILVVLDTRTGKYKYHPLPGNATRTFEFRD